MKMRRFLSVLLCAAFILTLVPVGSVHAAENSFTFDGLTISGDIAASDLLYDDIKTLYLKPRQDGGFHTITLSGTTVGKLSFVVSQNARAYITLNNLQMIGDSFTFSVGSGATAILYLRGQNTLISNSGSGLIVNYNATVIIEQAPPKPGENEEDIKGFLYATGSADNPGISAARKDWADGTHSYPTLYIRSGTVTAIGGRQAAGIGGGNVKTGGKINISGGVVTVIGNRGAGIGGGNCSQNGGEIYISGGIVNAYSSEAGAGIGGGDDDSDGGKIYIAGGLINAVGAGYAAGIGGGNNGTSGDITITGGTVIATGGSGGAGIGGGKHNNNEGGNVDTIRLYGGTIFASGKDGGEDIGRGAGGTSISEIFIADHPDAPTNIPTAVFLRNDTPQASTFTNIDSVYSHVGPKDYAGISQYGIELPTLFPSTRPAITMTLPEGVEGPGDDWLTNFWANQLNLWSSAANAGAYLQLKSIYYHNMSMGPGEIVQSQHRGTAGKILDGSIVSNPGYTFITWKTYAGKTYNPGTSYTFNDSLELDATWSPVTYDISYDLDGGTVSISNPTSYTIETADFSLNNPTKTGYTFAGWSGTGIIGTSMNVTISKRSTGNRSYTANWTPNTYTVCYDANSGTGTMADTTHTYDVEAPLRNNAFTRSGYSFAGWAASPGGEVAYLNGQSVINLTQSGVVNLYAKWTPDDYTITYHLNGGAVSPANPTSYTIESDAITLTNPTKTGYTFAGWSGTGISGTSMNVTIPAGSTGPRSYTANWTPNNYTVCYDANGGTGTMADTTHIYDVEAPLRNNGFTRFGYSFAGWAAAPGGDVVYLNGQSVINLAKSGVVTLYAKWTPDDYTITYHLNGGAVSPANTTNYTIESDAITLTNPTKTGYDFAGWSGTGITGDPVMTVTIPAGSTGSRSYTAHWTETPPCYSFRTLTDIATGISVSGTIRDDAALTVKDMTLGTDAACDAIGQRMNDDDYVLLLGKDISLSQGFIGTLTITMPVGALYNGQTVTILHCAGGMLQTYTATVTDGKALFSVSSLSPFAVFAQVFVTPDYDPPTVVTTSVTEVSAIGAKLNGSVVADGGAAVTERGFVCGTVSNPIIGGAGVIKVTAGSGTGSFTATLTGLKPDTAYYVRAYATNSEGTSYGAAISFCTDKDDPDVIPRTGDSSSPWVWWLLCGVSAAGIITLVVLSKRIKVYKR
jgi:uncharacterized repeat protein (TIGR02543 family)